MAGRLAALRLCTRLPCASGSAARSLCVTRPFPPWGGVRQSAEAAQAAEEAEMRSHEAQVARTLSAKNEFEAGVYALRARLDDNLGAHGGGSSMRESLRGALDEAEEWL